MNYYGNGFDSTGYLNKFFDLEAHLPELQTFDTEIYQNNENQYFFISISNMLVRYFKLSRRDFLIYRDKINKLQNCNALNDNSSEGICISLFVPIIIILGMKNMEEKRKFLDGNSKFLEIVKMLPEGQYLYKRFASSECGENNELEDGCKRFKVAYKFLFGDAEISELTAIGLNISRSCKEKILSYCGQM